MSDLPWSPPTGWATQWTPVLLLPPFGAEEADRLAEEALGGSVIHDDPTLPVAVTITWHLEM
jgi:hypothetical protein